MPEGKYFKSVDDMVKWIRNPTPPQYDEPVFLQAVETLDQVLVVDAVGGGFHLSTLSIMYKFTGISYSFENPQTNAIIHIRVRLPESDPNSNSLQNYVLRINQSWQEQYTGYIPLERASDVVLLGKARKCYKRDSSRMTDQNTGEERPMWPEFHTEIDGYGLEILLQGSLLYKNWDNQYLKYFQFSYRDLPRTTTTAK